MPPTPRHAAATVPSGAVRLEPMLACIVAGALVCNKWGQRRAFSSLLHRAMPPVLCFFFVTTGGSMRLGQARTRARTNS